MFVTSVKLLLRQGLSIYSLLSVYELEFNLNFAAFSQITAFGFYSEQRITITAGLDENAMCQ